MQEALDAEMAWRIKEVSALKMAAKANAVNWQVFVRAGVALVYAHWEGFIKTASEDYLSFVASRRHRYRELKSCFAVFGLKNKLRMLIDSGQAKPYIEAFDFVMDEMDKTAKMNMSSAIDTGSNLTSKVFANIAVSLDIATSIYETKYNLIDESLVNRINRIAHGEYLDLKTNEFGELADEVLQIMRIYKTDLQNAASLQSYKRSTHLTPSP